MNRRRTIVAVGLVAVLAVAACSGDDDGGGEGSAEPVDFGAPGPYDVGVADFEVNGQQIAAFYPADDAATDAEPYAYSGAELFGAELAAQLPGAFGEPQEVDGAFRDLTPSADAPFPVLLSSHGFGGYFRFSGMHHAQVASWGFVVISVDHPQRGVLSAFGGSAESDDSDVDDLFAALDFVEAGSDERLAGLIDPERVAVEGHSAGGSAAGLAAYARRVDTWIGLAPGAPVPREAFAGTGPDDFDVEAFYADNEPPDKPSMLIAADNDVAIALDDVNSLYGWLPTPRRLAVIENSGHGVFVDICLPIQQEGGLAEAVRRLGFDPESLSIIRLGEDGCLAEDTPAEDVFPIVDHLTVAQLRWVFAIDEAQAAASLDSSYLDAQFPGLLEEYRVDD